jgi:hypothetical protein
MTAGRWPRRRGGPRDSPPLVQAGRGADAGVVAAEVLAGVAGLGILKGQTWTRVVGIGFALLSMAIQFLIIPIYPIWSFLMIALDLDHLRPGHVPPRRSMTRAANF